MIIIMQRTIEHVVELTQTPGLDPNRIAYLIKLWEHVSPDNMKLTKEGITYAKIEI